MGLAICGPAVSPFLEGPVCVVRSPSLVLHYIDTNVRGCRALLCTFWGGGSPPEARSARQCRNLLHSKHASAQTRFCIIMNSFTIYVDHLTYPQSGRRASAQQLTGTWQLGLSVNARLQSAQAGSA